MSAILHFPADALPDPCPCCGTDLCEVCARVWGRTAVHFASDGICAFGHRKKDQL